MGCFYDSAHFSLLTSGPSSLLNRAQDFDLALYITLFYNYSVLGQLIYFGFCTLLHYPLSVEFKCTGRCSDIFIKNVLVCLIHSGFIAPSVIATDPGPDAAKEAQTMILQPPCFIDGIQLYWDALISHTGSNEC